MTKINKKIKIFIGGFLLSFLLFPKFSLAVCPVCTVAVSAGIGIGRWLGIDDTISGLWIGGLISSLVLWTENWLNKRKINYPLRFLSILIGYYILVLLPLYFFSDLLTSNFEVIEVFSLKFNKVIFGILIGSFVFWYGSLFHNFLKEKNKGKVYFPFQKVIIPISLLLIISFLFYFITKF